MFDRLHVTMSRLAAALLASAVCGCAPRPFEYSIGAAHPAAPDAPAGAPRSDSSGWISGEASGAHQHGAPAEHYHAGHPISGAPGDAGYACPMHPEVTSNEPGRCPKCNMPLEPRQQPAPNDAPRPAPREPSRHEHAQPTHQHDGGAP
jgi:hypothetical protein